MTNPLFPDSGELPGGAAAAAPLRPGDAARLSAEAAATCAAEVFDEPLLRTQRRGRRGADGAADPPDNAHSDDDDDDDDDNDDEGATAARHSASETDSLPSLESYLPTARPLPWWEIGRASCRERVFEAV